MLTQNFSLSFKSLVDLEASRQPPCLSLYQPTHRSSPENKQDPIRFRNLIKQLESSLRQKYTDEETRLLLEQYESLAQDYTFWEHTLDGLAVLSDTKQFRVYRLQRLVSEFVVVADSYHTKPLRSFLQSVDRYQILGLSLSKVQLFEGNRNSLEEIELAPGVPHTMIEALGDELTESYSTVASYGGVGQGSMPMHHGHGGKQEGEEIDAERFFRTIDRAIAERHSKPSGLPLILAALPEHHHLFQKVSHNSLLMKEGIPANPETLSIENLRERAWKVIEPQYQTKLNAVSDEFEVANSKGLGSDNLDKVAQAAVAGRVATLLIESDRQIAGRLNSITGIIELADLNDPQVDDLLDDLGELVAKMGGNVRVIPSKHMPSKSGLAATFRY
ncbi:MAG: hypothetical protein OEM52_02470 [bacterium]|nr:hypothetical protein [bacterium]